MVTCMRRSIAYFLIVTLVAAATVLIVKSLTGTPPGPCPLRDPITGQDVRAPWCR